MQFDLPERMLYVELLIYCTAEGSFPDDEKVIAKIGSCSIEQVRDLWPKIRHKFVQDSVTTGELINDRAAKVRQSIQVRKRKLSNALVRKRLEKQPDTKKVDSKSTQSRQAVNSRQKSSTSPSPSPSPSPSLTPNGDKKPGDLFAFFVRTFIGEIPDDLEKRFLGYVVGHVDELLANLPLWMQTRKYRDGFGTTADKFLQSGIWKKPPREELYGELKHQEPEEFRAAPPKAWD